MPTSTIFQARCESNLDEENLQKILENRLIINLKTTKDALAKVLTIDALKHFDKHTNLNPSYKHHNFEHYASSFPNSIQGFSLASNLEQLCPHFLSILYMPFGIRHIDDDHIRYMTLRSQSIQKHKNEDDDVLFTGTSSRRYVHGFSNHAYTFFYYLSLNQDKLTNDELECVIELFYYSYIKKNYHSFCEVDAAFLRASENYKLIVKESEVIITTPDESLIVERNKPRSEPFVPEEIKLKPTAPLNLQQIKKKFENSPKLIATLERLEKGSKSFNPYWINSSSKLSKMLNLLEKISVDSINDVLNNPTSELSSVIDERRIPGLFTKCRQIITESRKLISNPTP